MESQSSQIVYDREAELCLRKKSWFGRTSWKKYYAVLSRLRRCLYLFDGYWMYERHLLELNGYENEYKSWTHCIPLQSASLYVTTTYFHRPNTFELCTPSGIFYLNTDSESALRGWLFSLSLAGVLLKSDEKPLLLWRGVDESTGRASNCFQYCRASSSMPAARERTPVTKGWDSGYGIAKLVAKLSSKAAAAAAASNNLLSPAPSPLPSPSPKSHAATITAKHLLRAGRKGFNISDLQSFEPQPDQGFGKHGQVAMLGRSLFARFRGDSLASTDPNSPFYDVAAREKNDESSSSANDAYSLARGADKYSRWISRFWRTMENAAGKPVLLRYHSRDSTSHAQKSSHTILLTRCKVYDLAIMHARSTAYVQIQVEKEERERWKLYREMAGNNAGDQLDETLLAQLPGMDKKSRAQRKKEVRARVKEAFLNNPAFPAPLPSFAPAGLEDFALFITAENAASTAAPATSPSSPLSPVSPSSVTTSPTPTYRPAPAHPPQEGSWLFLRAPTPREKTKWVAVLRNLTGERLGSQATGTATASVEDLAGRKLLRALKPRESLAGTFLSPGSTSNAGEQQSLDELFGRADTTSPPPTANQSAAKQQPLRPYNTLRASPEDLLRWQEEDTASISDERVVHVCRRDFYAVLGLSPQATTQEITHKYQLMHRELLARLQPRSPLHKLVPLPSPIELERTMNRDAQIQQQQHKEQQLEETKEEENAQQPQHQHHLFTFNVESPTNQSLATEEERKERAPSSAVNLDERKEPAVSAASNLTGSFTHDGVTLSAIPESAGETAVKASTPAPTIATSSHTQQSPSPSPPPLPLSSTQAQARIQRQLFDLREVWRILKDPVRRVQYDERRFVLRLDELTGEEPNVPSVAASGVPAGSSNTATGSIPTHRTVNSIEDRPQASATAAASQPSPSLERKTMLDSVLERASEAAGALPLTPAKVVVGENVSKRPEDQEERKYLTPNDSDKPGDSSETHLQQPKAQDDDEKHAPSANGLSIHLGELEMNGLNGTNGTAHALNGTARPTNGQSQSARESPRAVHSSTVPASASFSSPISVASSNPASTAAAPLSIMKPDSFTKWMCGEQVEVLWNPTCPPSDGTGLSTPAFSPSPFGSPSPPTQKADPAHRVLIELLRRRPLVKDPVVAVLALEAENNGVFRFVVPRTLKPRADYYIRLTLKWADAVVLSSESTHPQHISRSSVFSIVALEKSPVYVDGLEKLYEASPSPVKSPAPSPLTTTPLKPTLAHQNGNGAPEPLPLPTVVFHTE